MVKKITFVIDADGEVSLEVEGAKGTECEELSKPFEEFLGSVEQKTFKDAYYEKSVEPELQEKSHGQ